MISLHWLTKRDDGQDLLEYGILVSLIAIVAIAAVRLLGDQVGNVFWAVIAKNF